MFNIIQAQNQIENFRKENDKALRRLFSGKIKGSFLTEIKYLVLSILGDDIQKYYDFQITNEKMVSTGIEMVEFDICRHIVGLHRSNLVFNTEEERLIKEQNTEYKKKLANEVVINIKLRQYGSVFFRKQQILKGENFIFFHTPYNLFVLSIKMNELLCSCNKRDIYYSIIASIANKGLAALTLLEDNFLDNAYPICRGMLELYIKLLLFLNCPTATEKYSKFTNFELIKSCCKQNYSKEFNNLFNNRLNQSSKNKIDFLHYGWLDSVSDYHLGGFRPYSIDGIMAYLKAKHYKEQQNYFDNVEFLYKMCHGFTHGNIHISKYPLLHYFEISTMLYYALSYTYRVLCEYLKVDIKINGIDILDKTEKDFYNMEQQYNQKSTDSFELYYKLNKI